MACAVLWLANAPESFRAGTVQHLREPRNPVGVSATASAELACLVREQRVELPCHGRRWFRDAVESNGWRVFDVELKVTEEAYSLPGAFHPDPADRAIVATARLNRLSVVTGDARILDYPHVESTQ